MRTRRPLVASFVEHGLPTMERETRTYVHSLFERYVGRGLAWLRSQVIAEYTQSVDTSVVTTLADLLKVRLFWHE
jgi:hypothetical protein